MAISWYREECWDPGLKYRHIEKSGHAKLAGAFLLTTGWYDRIPRTVRRLSIMSRSVCDGWRRWHVGTGRVISATFGTSRNWMIFDSRAYLVVLDGPSILILSLGLMLLHMLDQIRHQRVRFPAIIANMDS